jgi:hypothetical protein
MEWISFDDLVGCGEAIWAGARREGRRHRHTSSAVADSPSNRGIADGSNGGWSNLNAHPLSGI